jgi:hypothetical protein
MKPAALFASLCLALACGLAAHAAERSLDKQVGIPAMLVQAWEAWTTREGIVSFFAPDAKLPLTPPDGPNGQAPTDKLP